MNQNTLTDKKLIEELDRKINNALLNSHSLVEMIETIVHYNCMVNEIVIDSGMNNCISCLKGIQQAVKQGSNDLDDCLDSIITHRNKR